MIQSMTGFGRSEISSELYNVVVEAKSVNNRFKDIRFKIPSIFSQYEIEMKNMIGSMFKRGSFDIHISYKKTNKLGKLDDLDEEKIKKFIEKMSGISKDTKTQMDFRPCDFLRSEFYSDRDEQMVTDLYSLAKKGLEEALSKLRESRITEGKKLIEAIILNRKEYDNNLTKVEERSVQYKDEVTDRLKKRFNDFSSEIKIDEPRFLQEVVYYLEKLDINEEIDRIKTHIIKLDKMISSDKEIGRELDFLVQELGRETNTIGSKSGHKEISDVVVQMKVRLEKIREQGLNLE